MCDINTFYINKISKTVDILLYNKYDNKQLHIYKYNNNYIYEFSENNIIYKKEKKEINDDTIKEINNYILTYDYGYFDKNKYKIKKCKFTL